MPLWHVAGFALGAVTALLGEKAAFACTVAVESVIDEHYRAQQERLGQTKQRLPHTIEEFRAEELEHHDTSLEPGGQRSAVIPGAERGVKAASRLAIWISTRF